ncbi:hypothetical protein [Nannocystis pusilla]|uniref:Lipoprotein n=1 Tax=Nannocystis pusilla TaxID=889268 RepID=A0ABS7TM08_9BACT|nr:hypothetical protein [Nannocystis pusilla]MBZ5709264.1 hypothetical protein [Nannocystis pusilla]
MWPRRPRTTAVCVWLLATACDAAPTPRGEPRSYPLIHMETTGLTTALHVDGKSVTIAWDPASNEQALAELDALQPETFLGLTRGRALHVVGSLSPEIHQTPSGPGRPTSEPYHSFTLHDWYVVPPFRRLVPASDDPLDGMVPGPLVEQLSLEDFRALPDGRALDPRAHERATRDEQQPAAAG